MRIKSWLHDSHYKKSYALLSSLRLHKIITYYFTDTHHYQVNSLRLQYLCK